MFQIICRTSQTISLCRSIHQARLTNTPHLIVPSSLLRQHQVRGMTTLQDHPLQPILTLNMTIQAVHLHMKDPLTIPLAFLPHMVEPDP
jgi:hypothetical protein